MARVIETKRKTVVDRSLRHGPIRTGIANVREFLQGMEANPLSKPAGMSLSRLAICCSTLEQTSMQFDSTLSGLTALRQEWVRSAQDAAGGRRFLTSEDLAGFTRDYIEKREKEHRERIAKSVAEKFGDQASAAAEKAVAALQDYDREMARQRVIHDGLFPTHPNVPGSIATNQLGFERMKLEAASWPWLRRLGYLQDLNQLFNDGDPQLEVGELILMTLINEYEANPPTYKPGVDRTGKLEDERRCVAKIKALIENRRASRSPLWLKYHEHIVWPAIVTLAKNTIGHDVRSMSATDLARWSKSPRKPWDVKPDWAGRYCLPSARELLARNFSTDMKYSPPDIPTLSEALEEQRKKQPKKAAG